MRAIHCHELDGPEALVLEEADTPEPGPGQVRLAVHAASVNFADTLMIRGLYQEKPPTPFTPGMEAAGVIDAVGADVSDVAVGDRVMGTLGWGGFAEAAVTDAGNVFKIPDGMTMPHAACFPVAYGTSHVGLAHRGQLKSGEILLVHGAGGGVGVSAVQIGKAMGARVIGTARGKAKLDTAREAGADDVIDYSKEDIRERVLELTDGHGADVIYDPVGGDVFDTSLRCIAWEGRLLVIGFAAGRIPEAPANRLLLKNCSAVGVFWGAYRKHNFDVVTRSFEELFRMYEAGQVAPLVGNQYSLEDTAQAFTDLEDRKVTGKAVVLTGLEE